MRTNSGAISRRNASHPPPSGVHRFVPRGLFVSIVLLLLASGVAAAAEVRALPAAYHPVTSMALAPDQKRLALMMAETGFIEVEYQNLTGGIAALHLGTRPRS